MAIFALIDRLAPYVEKELKAAMNSEQEAGNLSSKLKKVQVGLLEAEKQGATNPSVRNWLKEVEEVMFEMEDLLDEWEALNPSENESPSNLWESFKDKSPSNTWDKVLSVILSICSCFKPVFDGRREVALKMMDLNNALDKILLEERNKYNFTSGESNHPRSSELVHVESSSGLDHSQVYSGRQVDQERLLSKLVPEGEESSTGTQIISIFGVGGVGKTTLAQLVFNHEKVKQHFDVRAWAFVGDPFEPTKVAAAILEDLDKSKNASNKPSTLNSIEKCIEDITSGKKFLVVLDDVWTEERIKWSQLKKCLIKGAPGSKILVTTRNEAVARMMETTHWQPLGLLCDEDCANILNRIALKERSEAEQGMLRNIGREIAKKCNGLPLAANAVGSMLASKSTQQQWLQVLNSPLWEYENEVSDIYRLLKLSYLDLDSILKHCFLSCILYSKGYQIPLRELVRRWVGYGYINSSSSEDAVQSKGLEYFEKLKMRYFIQKIDDDDDDDGEIRFKVHDVMHDFAIYMSGIEQISFIIITPKVKGSSDTGAQHRNFSGKSLEKIRTFSAKHVSQEELPPNLFSVLRSVRVLTVLDCNLQELPSEIGKLIHLRHIDLSWNPFTELPTSVTDLYHLETLDVQGCDQLLRLPQGIEKLRKLRHLLIKNTPNLREFPEGLRKLTKLCTLCKFVAGEFGSELGWLENLNELSGSLSIEIAVVDTKDAEKANLRNKTHIQHLHLRFAEDVQMEVILEALQPPSQIETLTISGDKCKQFPSWLMEPMSHNKLKELHLDGFDDSALPLLSKLPSLEILYISDMEFKILECEFFGMNLLADAEEGSSTVAGGFTKLKILFFLGCESWEEWEDIGDLQVSLLPCLEEIYLLNCSKLKGLPHNFLRSAKALRNLCIHESELLELRYNLESGTDRDKISHIPDIEIGSKDDEDEDEEEEREEDEI